MGQPGRVVLLTGGSGYLGRVLAADFTFIGRYEPDDSVTIVAAWSATGQPQPDLGHLPVTPASVSELVR